MRDERSADQDRHEEVAMHREDNGLDFARGHAQAVEEVVTGKNR